MNNLCGNALTEKKMSFGQTVPLWPSNWTMHAGGTRWRDKRFEFNQAEEECELDFSFPNANT